MTFYCILLFQILVYVMRCGWTTLFYEISLIEGQERDSCYRWRSATSASANSFEESLFVDVESTTTKTATGRQETRKPPSKIYPRQTHWIRLRVVHYDLGKHTYVYINNLICSPIIISSGNVLHRSQPISSTRASTYHCKHQDNINHYHICCYHEQNYCRAFRGKR